METSTIIWIVVAVVVVLIIIGVIAYLANRNSEEKRPQGRRAAVDRTPDSRSTSGRAVGTETRGGEGVRETTRETREVRREGAQSESDSDTPTRGRRGRRR